MTDPAIKNQIRVASVADGAYIVSVVDDGQESRSLCRLVSTETRAGKVKTIKFESNDFQRLIMLGRVSIKDVMARIDAVES